MRHQGNDLEVDEIESVLLEKFGETLSKRAMISYHNLPPNSNDSFAMLLFCEGTRWNYQGRNQEIGPLQKQLKQNLIKYPVVTWDDVHNRYQSKIRVEESAGAPSRSVYPARPADRVKRDIDCEPRSNRDRYQLYNEDRRSNGSGWSSVRNERKNDRGQNNRGLMSKNGFDRPIGQKEASRTKDCRQLRVEVARLFNNGHFRELLSERAKNHFRNRDYNKQTKQEEPQRVIHMIIGRADVPQGPMLKSTKVYITREKQTQDYIPEGTLSFSDKDAEEIVQPHKDALVISVLMNKSRVERVLIDPGSSANIMQSRVVGQLGLQDLIVLAARVLNGFNMACETTKGEITLPVNTTGTSRKPSFM
ncbi:PREDICTED: uncharacterized protein LOC109243570 [Nicotiana attenuata]|uniref:uncharacterized protein LOC109243570 n=1 Tax=Nicotiana attenuata TaxID=49451 RepID=UPI00090528E3|nr:PREDICTED: uncharacterized protein LOC109243570 [Nicotiana attenuata]